MIRFTHFKSTVALAALLASTMLPIAAYAGEQTRAEAAIAEAKGKIDAGDKVGAGDQAPQLQGQARAALATAQDLLSHHKKTDAIVAAHHASDFADQAIMAANSRKASSERDRRDDLRDTASNAQATAASANLRADSAEQATAAANARANSAEQSSAAANVRANSAELSSAAANAQADALRNAPPPVASPSVTTVAVTEHDAALSAPAASHHKRHRVVRHHGRSSHVKTTTTVITTNHP